MCMIWGVCFTSPSPRGCNCSREANCLVLRVGFCLLCYELWPRCPGLLVTEHVGPRRRGVPVTEQIGPLCRGVIATGRVMARRRVSLSGVLATVRVMARRRVSLGTGNGPYKSEPK